MQNGKLLVKRLHLLAMRAIVITPLAVPRLLVLPDAHDLCRLGPNVDQVCQRSHKHGSVQPSSELVSRGRSSNGREEREGRSRSSGGRRSEERRQECSCAAAGIRQEHGGGENGLQAEVDGECVFLERGELRAGEDAEGDDAGDEGLEERGAEERPIAVRVWCQFGCDDGM